MVKINKSVVCIWDSELCMMIGCEGIIDGMVLMR